MRAFVIDNHGFILTLTITNQFDRMGIDIKHIIIQRIHFAGKFNANDTIINIPQRCRCGFVYGFTGQLDIAQQQHTLRPDQRMIFAIDAKDHLLTIVDFIKRSRSDLGQQCGHGQSFGLQPLRKPCCTQLIDHFERAVFPVITKAHRFIDIGDIIGNLRHQRRGIR